jgi:hypothetical protein
MAEKSESPVQKYSKQLMEVSWPLRRWSGNSPPLVWAG